MESMERALLTDEELKPGPRFTHAVMEAVRREAEPPPIRFPWAAVWAGAAVGLALGLPALLGLGGAVGATPSELASWLAEGLALAPRLSWVVAVAVGSALLAWLPLELVEA